MPLMLTSKNGNNDAVVDLMLFLYRTMQHETTTLIRVCTTGLIRSSTMLSTPMPIAISLMLLLSVPLLFVLAPRFRYVPGSSIRGETVGAIEYPDDLLLFRRAVASATAASKTIPPPSSPSSLSHLGTTKPKIAFLFLSNSDLFFAPLWERFFEGNRHLYNVYVHIDPSARLHVPLSGVFTNRSIASKRTARSSPTLISAERRLLATAIIDDPANVLFALLSQTCIPLHSFRFVYHTLFSSPTVKAGMSSESDAGLSRLGVRVSYPSYIEILSEDPWLWDRYNARGKRAMLPEVHFSQFRVGSQFFVLNRRHALLVIRERRLWRKFKLPCRSNFSCYPEEHYFPTLLSMKDPNGCAHYSLTRVNWTGTVDGHPHTYRPTELSAQLIYDLRRLNATSSYLFARKFSPDCLDQLMGMADTVLFRD